MLFAQVSEQGREELKSAIDEAHNVKWYRRLKVIDLSAQGHRVPEIAHWFDLSEATVRRYIQQYNAGGLAELQPGRSPGRNASITLTQAEWEDLLARRPSQFEALNTRARNWSQPLLQRYFYHYHQLEVTQSTISSTLKRQDVSWKRAKKK